MEPSSRRRDVKLLGDLPEAIAFAGIEVCRRPRHWRTPVVLAFFRT
jgi:hypothetical protein